MQGLLFFQVNGASLKTQSLELSIAFLKSGDRKNFESCPTSSFRVKEIVRCQSTALFEMS